MTNSEPAQRPERTVTTDERLTEGEQIEEDLELDMHVYGCCFYKFVDGKKVRVHPHDVRWIKGEPRDSTNTVVTHCQEG